MVYESEIKQKAFLKRKSRNKKILRELREFRENHSEHNLNQLQKHFRTLNSRINGKY
jgi:hypothetical protein